MGLSGFFLFCSGAAKGYLKRSPSEHNKYIGIGATVFFTAVFAFLASAYALFTVFENYFISIGFGLIWGSMIFNLDRYIVSSMKKTGKIWQEWGMAIPRLILATLLAVVISRPLELKIFQPEIEEELILMKEEIRLEQENAVQKRYSDGLQKLEAEWMATQAIADSARYRRDKLASMAMQEADGTGGSMQKNLGPIFKVKKEKADLAAAEYDSIAKAVNSLLQEKNLELSEFKARQSADIARITGDGFRGLAARLEALERLGQKYATIAWAGWFIFLLFIAIETAPVIVKLISMRGPLDEVQTIHEHRYIVSRVVEVSKMNHQANEELAYYLKPKLDQRIV
jgi:hypothetical protein